MSSKKILAVLLCLVMIFALAACGGSDTDNGGVTNGGVSPDVTDNPGNTDNGGSSNGAKKDSVKVAVSNDAGSLMPMDVDGSGFFTVTGAYMETLLTVNSEGGYDWVLGTAMDTIDDMHYTLHLREGVTFNNGNPFTAEDVMFTFGVYKNNAMRMMYLQSIDYEKTSIIDDYTIDLWYSEVNLAQLSLMSGVYIMDAESFDTVDWANAPVGTGPYVLNKYVTNSYSTWILRDDYWGGASDVKNIEFVIIEEDSQKITALETGAIDVLREVPTAEVDYVKTLSGYNTVAVNTGTNVMLQFNQTTVFDSKEARYAVCHALDKQSVVKLAFDGTATIAYAPVTNQYPDWFDGLANLHSTYSTGYDLDVARQYAEESGLVGKTVDIVTNGSSYYVTTAEILMNALKQIGVESSLTNYDSAAMYEILYDASSGWDLIITNTASPALMGSELLTGYMGFANYGVWSGPEYDEFVALSKTSMQTTDEDEFEAIYLEMVTRFADACTWYGICDQTMTIAYAEGISNIRAVGMGNLRPFDWVLS